MLRSAVALATRAAARPLPAALPAAFPAAAAPAAPAPVLIVALDRPALRALADLTVDAGGAEGGFQAMNRNARKPKRANHGKRAVSHFRRRQKMKRRSRRYD